MFFRQILHEEKSCISYLVGCQSYGVCVIVDPQGDLQFYLSALAKHDLKLTHVIETHIQADHASIAPQLAETTGAVLYFGPEAHVSFPYKMLNDGETFTIGRERLKNKALRFSEEEFVNYITQNLPPTPEDFQTIKRVNMGLDG